MTKIPDRCAETIIDPERVRRAESELLDGLTATRLAAIFKALADPTRLRIVSLLAHHELCVCDLAATLGMTQSAVSHQLRLMRELRLVQNRKEGRMVYYTLDDEHIHDLFDRGLEHLEHTGHQASDSRLQTPDSRLQTPDSRHQISDS